MADPHNVAAHIDAAVFIDFNIGNAPKRYCFSCGAESTEAHSEGCDLMPLVRLLAVGTDDVIDGLRIWLADATAKQRAYLAQFEIVGAI